MKNTRLSAERDSKKKGYRYRLWRHEVESIERLSRLMQRADRTLRLLDATRTAVTGLAMSPYVTAVSEQQGVEITRADVAGQEDDGYADSINIGL